ncbi:hypothetical protein Q4P54_06185 [Neisseria gonorrhoeae]|nr:hypothetical protein [Neisseria gonorrhoeae]
MYIKEDSIFSAASDNGAGPNGIFALMQIRPYVDVQVFPPGFTSFSVTQPSTFLITYRCKPSSYRKSIFIFCSIICRKHLIVIAAVHNFADDFEILFLMAQYGSEYWNSLEESFEEFCIRHTTLPNQLIADIPHAKKEKVTMWLKSLLHHVAKIFA